MQFTGALRRSGNPDGAKPAMEPPDATTETGEARAGMANLLQHMDAVYNLARWLVPNASDAEDLAQEAYLRAFRSIHTLRGRESRSWMLTIVRNACYDWTRRARTSPVRGGSPEEMESAASAGPSQETVLLEKREADLLREVLNSLPPLFREVLNLRELEELTYRQIAQITQVPEGTVMSRLSRARQQLDRALRLRREAAMATPSTAE